jgi:hypothetical protein
MGETYQGWVERLMSGRDARPLSPNDSVTTSGGEPFETVTFNRVDRQHYVGEVGRKNTDYIYHFYPKTERKDFEDRMGDAFLEVFKMQDRLESAYSPELKSWAVKARMFAVIPMDELASRVFDILDRKLG